MRIPLIAGNWKMHGNQQRALDLVAAARLAADHNSSVEVLVCPPFPYLLPAAVAAAGSRLSIGAQDCAATAAGAWTGEVAASMVADCGARWCLVGHSERRQSFGESDQLVAQKFLQAQGAGLTPILCVGETLTERESGHTMVVVARQIASVLAAAGIKAFANAVLAYEPVWAIGTGRTASNAQAQEVHAAIRSQIAKEDVMIASSLRIVYGGSVKPANAGGLLAEADIDGALVGGASLDSQEFAAIVAAAG